MPNSIDELLTLLNEFICENQLRLSQHTFIASEKHKRVKVCMSELEGFWETDKKVTKNLTNPSLISDKRVIELNEELSDSLTDLETYLHSTFKDASEFAFDYALKFFSHRFSVMPRACVKVIAGEKIISLFRRPSSVAQSLDININESTAFEKIASGARYFLCNNIPAGIKDGEYQNVKIIKERVIDYEKSEPDQISLSGESAYAPDEKWAKCWKEIILVEDGKEKVISYPIDSCYKSALVIPMSLTTGRLDKQFMSHFRISTDSSKAIFGFLCFDHQNTSFFDESIDSKFGFILADILSLYLIQQLTYTQYSSAYFQAVSLLTHDELPNHRD